MFSRGRNCKNDDFEKRSERDNGSIYRHWKHYFFFYFLFSFFPNNLLTTKNWQVWLPVKGKMICCRCRNMVFSSSLLPTSMHFFSNHAFTSLRVIIKIVFICHTLKDCSWQVVELIIRSISWRKKFHRTLQVNTLTSIVDTNRTHVIQY